MSSFGGVIPVLALNNGFLGNVSRIGERVIAARPVLSTSTNPINFGDACTLISDATGGTWQRVADFISQGGTFTAAKFAGVAVRNVKTQLQFQTLTQVQPSLIGQYLQGQMAEVLERGSITVKCNNGSPTAGSGVFVRIVFNGAIPAGVVGGFEAVADGVNTVALTGVVFRTGVVDANGVAEITMLARAVA